MIKSFRCTFQQTTEIHDYYPPLLPVYQVDEISNKERQILNHSETEL